MNQLSLFDDATAEPAPPQRDETTEGRSYIGQPCTLDGKPARVKDGGPTFALIEPVDLEEVELYVPWDDVAWAFGRLGDPEFKRGQS